MRIIGISHKTRYWQNYVFNNPPEEYRYSRMLDFPWHMTGIVSAFLWHTRHFFPVKPVDLYHTYNCIVANKKPWVVEVESYMPRYRPMKENHYLYKWGYKRLASKDCRKLIFTSKFTMEMNKQKLVDHGVDPEKMTVAYRAVEQFLPGEKDKDRFTILFAGNGFYRKGGIELLKAFLQLPSNDAQLWIVSALQVDWGVTATVEQIAWAHRTIEEHPHIHLWSGISHTQLIQTMRKAHVFVSTTFSDPFNNTVLEAMGCQLPVITSDVSSIPEIVSHEENGILVPVTDRESDDIAKEISTHLTRLMDDTELREKFSKRSLQIVREKFDLPVRNKALSEIYDQALR